MTTHMIVQLNDIVFSKLAPVLGRHDQIYLLPEITKGNQQIMAKAIDIENTLEIYWVNEQVDRLDEAITKQTTVIGYAEFISKIQNQSAIKSWY